MRHLKEEQANIKEAIEFTAQKRAGQEKEIEKMKNSAHVIVLGDGKFTSFGLVPDNRHQSNSAMETAAEEDEKEEGQSAV